jgi:hypothetical protein
MTPEGQLSAPFFLGGAVIQVSSPASSQSIEQRMEALRRNNIYFARATVFHELIPGHHMQQYMTQQYRTYRSPFSTPFWTEGMESRQNSRVAPQCPVNTAQRLLPPFNFLRARGPHNPGS